jgi:hypothetical protein
MNVLNHFPLPWWERVWVRGNRRFPSLPDISFFLQFLKDPFGLIEAVEDENGGDGCA